jgi:hypothetical protein
MVNLFAVKESLPIEPPCCYEESLENPDAFHIVIFLNVGAAALVTNHEYIGL